MKVRALDSFDNFRKGDEPDLPPKYAQEVVDLGLAERVDGEKAAPPTENKMAAPASNKAAGRGNNQAVK